MPLWPAAAGEHLRVPRGARWRPGYRRGGSLAAGPDLGVIDLGRDGWAVVCAVTPVNFTLRSGTERDVLLAGFARWLHSLALPVQILTRTHPVELTADHRRAAPQRRSVAASRADRCGVGARRASASARVGGGVAAPRVPDRLPHARHRPPRPLQPAARPRWAWRGRPRRTGRSWRRSRNCAAAPRRPSGCWAGSDCASPHSVPAEATRVLHTATRPDLAATVAADADARPRHPVRVAARAGATAAVACRTPWRAGSRGGLLAETGSATSTRTAAGRTRRGGVGVDDEPTIELDVAAAAAGPGAWPRPVRVSRRARARTARSTPTSCAPPRGRALPRSAGRVTTPRTRPRADDPEATTTRSSAPTAACVEGSPVRADASAIAAAIAAALEPRRTALDVEDGRAEDVAVAEDMTLDGDEDPDSEPTLGEQTLGDESRHDAATSADAPPAGSPPRRATRPIGTP